MNGEYKQTLERFEKAVMRIAMIGTVDRVEEREEIEEEYDEAKQALVKKFQYLAAFYRRTTMPEQS